MSGLSQKSFRLFDSCFCLAICLLVSRTSWSVLKTPFVGKVTEFLASKLWAIVTYDDVWYALSREVPFQVLYDSAGCCVRKVVDFPEISEIVNNDQVVLAIVGVQICTNLLPWAFCNFIAHQGLSLLPHLIFATRLEL